MMTMMPLLHWPSAAKVHALKMSFFAAVFLFKVMLTMAQSESQLFFVLNSFREPGTSNVLKQIHTRSRIQCCFVCDKTPTCGTANFHSGDTLCELIAPGTTLMSPEASTGWTFVYTDSKYLEHFFNAVASQATTLTGGEAARAIDGNTTSNFYLGSCSHTLIEKLDVWWMVDLFVDFQVERVTLWNRMDCSGCYERLRDLTITVSQTLDGVDDPANLCATYPGPPSSQSDNPVTVTCTRGMLGRYVKILARENTLLSLCEFDFA